MNEPFPELHGFGLEFAAVAARLASDGPAIDDAFSASFSKQIARYNKAINDALAKYADIDYHESRQEKIHAKAIIDYACDFLSLLVDILKVLERGGAPAIRERASLLEEIILQRDALVETSYADTAARELECFYDPGVREQLEEKLARMLEGRRHGGGA